MSTNTSSDKTYLIHLHKEGKIDDNALNKALNALQSTPTQTVESDVQSTALENLRRKRRDKKNERQSRKYAELQESFITELKQVLKARISVSELKLVDKPRWNYFKTYEIDASNYKNASNLFADKNLLSPVKSKRYIRV